MYGGPSVVTGKTVVRGFLFPMTSDAIAQAEHDVALGDRLVRDVAVAGRALDIGPNVRRVIELDVGRLGVAVNALPRQIDPFFRIGGDFLNPRLVGRNRRVTDQTGVDARES